MATIVATVCLCAPETESANNGDGPADAAFAGLGDAGAEPIPLITPVPVRLPGGGSEAVPKAETMPLAELAPGQIPVITPVPVRLPEPLPQPVLTPVPSSGIEQPSASAAAPAALPDVSSAPESAAAAAPSPSAEPAVAPLVEREPESAADSQEESVAAATPSPSAELAAAPLAEREPEPAADSQEEPAEGPADKAVAPARKPVGQPRLRKALISDEPPVAATN